MIKIYQTILVILLLFACKEKNHLKYHKVINRNIKNVENYEYQDSLFASEVLPTCQNLINIHKNKNHFIAFTDTIFRKYKSNPENNTTNIYGKIEITSSFNNARKFIKINRTSTHGFIYIDIEDVYTKSPILHEKIWYGNFISESIFDCNKDGYHDYILKTMTTNGTGPREESYVYLYNSKTTKFEKPILLMNASFDISKKEFNCMNNGHEKETFLYRVKINNFKLDTVVSLHHHPNDPLKYVLSKSAIINLKTDKIINKVPFEFKKDNNNYSWFMGF